MVAQTVVSVGPYALTRNRSRAQVCTRAGGHASPASTSVLPAGSEPGGITASAAGGRVRWVMPRSRTRPARVGPGSRAFRSSISRQAPESRPMHSSQNAASKLTDAMCSTRLAGVTRSRSLWVLAMAPTPLWVTTTPFGRPVEPDV